MRKAYRVKSEADFGRVFHQGKSTANRQFVVYTIDKEQTHFRLGISVGKKIGNAVTRNYVKRRIRQSVYELRDAIRPNQDFIVIARKPTAQMSMAEIKKSLEHVFNLAGIFKSEAK
ncbi:ribonuclease P protein component [Aerococcus sp. UMB1112A]|uniref:ribonuclease P protein component n=1 Tax=Aerococcus sp. UMB1112A TaxID=3050609 RepID=UPI00254BC0DB|nr:ribonuclease P protein component [Aerococcus sp. UMB1112A]MDK8502767.1 ribonuclease P protein component [Aerococcus sp. UMB1112A]